MFLQTSGIYYPQTCLCVEIKLHQEREENVFEDTNVHIHPDWMCLCDQKRFRAGGWIHIEPHARCPVLDPLEFVLVGGKIRLEESSFLSPCFE